MKIWISSTLFLIAKPSSFAISNSNLGFDLLMPQPKSLWSLNVSPAKYGNECKVFSNDELLICSGIDGTTVAVTPTDGKKVWVHNPLPTTLTNVRSSSGISFGYTPTIGHYVAHAVS
jgi:outer membrane protein assembly factor BamB